MELKFEGMSYQEWREAMARKPITFGDLKIFVRELDGTVEDDSPILIPGYEDNGYDAVITISEENVLVNDHFDGEDTSFSSKYQDARYYPNDLEIAYNEELKGILVEAIVLKSDKYLMRRNDASE